MSNGCELIRAERQRQIEAEGWSQERDCEVHAWGQLAEAAACYALGKNTVYGSAGGWVYLWPWDKRWWKPTPESRIKELVKAGALIAAEIDRLEAMNNEA